MKIQFATILFALISWCCQNNRENVRLPEKSVDNEPIIAQEQSHYIENGELTSQWESDLAQLAKSRGFIVEKEPVNNRHVDNLVDTIKHYKLNGIHMQSYKAVNEEWIFDAKVHDPTVELANGIHVGVHKEALEELLRTKLNSDSIRVGNFEGTSLFIFRFKKDTLTKIVFEGYAD